VSSDRNDGISTACGIDEIEDRRHVQVQTVLSYRGRLTFDATGSGKEIGYKYK